MAVLITPLTKEREQVIELLNQNEIEFTEVPIVIAAAKWPRPVLIDDIFYEGIDEIRKHVANQRREK